jgi:hypothetical protein
MEEVPVVWSKVEQAADKIPSRRSGHTLTAIGNVAYLFGGECNNDAASGLATPSRSGTRWETTVVLEMVKWRAAVLEATQPGLFVFAQLHPPKYGEG